MKIRTHYNPIAYNAQGEKQCCECRTFKPVTAYAKCNQAPDGLRRDCKDCANLYRKTKAHEAGVIPRDQLGTPYNDKGEKWCRYCGTWQVPEAFPRDRTKRDGRNIRCKACDKQRAKEYRKSTPPAVLAARLRDRYASNIQYRLRANLHNRLNWALKGIAKSAGTLELLGCTIDELKQHLEKQFQPGMTWDNHSPTGWHIGHRKDCWQFDLTDPAQQRACFHYTNLFPQWAQDNWRQPKSRTDAAITRQNRVDGSM
jgi:hypothetical protein